MASPFVKYNCFPKDLAEKKHDFVNDSFKVSLTNRAPVVAADRVLADIVELAAVNGYPAGGIAAAVASSSQAGGVYKSVLSDPGLFVAAGGVIGPARYAVVRNATADHLVGYYDYGAGGFTLANGESFTLDLDQAGGLFTIT